MWSWVSQCKIQIQFRLPIIKHNNQTFQIAIANCAFLWSSTFAKASSNDGDEFAGIPQRYADPTYSFPLNQVLPSVAKMHLFWVAWYHFLTSISPHNTLLSEHCRVKNVPSTDRSFCFLSLKGPRETLKSRFCLTNNQTKKSKSILHAQL